MLSVSNSSTIVHKRKLVLELTQRFRTTCQKKGALIMMREQSIEQNSTIVNKRKLVLELTQRGFPTNCPSRSWEEKLVAPLIATPNGEVRK